LPPFLDQEMQQPGFRRIRLQGAQLFAMTQQQIQQRICVTRVTLGTRWSEGLAVARGRAGVDHAQPGGHAGDAARPIAMFDRRIAELVADHPDAAVFRSLPPPHRTAPAAR